MPVEILEIIVRANVQELGTDVAATSPANSTEGDNIQQQAIVEECVEQVLEILRHRTER